MLLRDFTRQGRFAWVTKEDVLAWAWARDRRWMVRELHDLNEALMEYDLGFGYRVVDEILAFVAAVTESPLADDLPESVAFDAAVMMKVLPKFHGPLDRVQGPCRPSWTGQGRGRRPATSAPAGRSPGCSGRRGRSGIPVMRESTEA